MEMTKGRKAALWSILGCAAIVAVVTDPAMAATLNVASITGTWSNVETTSKTPGALTGEQTDSIDWGVPVPGSFRSQYSFVDTGSVSRSSPGAFLIGEYRHDNGRIWSYSQDLLYADLSLTLTGDFDGEAFTLANTFRFTHDETLNSARPCPKGPAGGLCGDIVSFTSLLAAPITFIRGDTIFTLAIEGLVASLGGGPVSDLLTAEGQRNSLYLQASLTSRKEVEPAPVPLPLPAFMLLASIAATATVVRKRTGQNRKR
jgi:hypothetical protein